MAFNTESAFAERNIQRASHYLLQKRKIAQSLTRSIQTLKAKNTQDTSAGTGKLCILGHLGLVFIWSCFVSCLL